MKIAKRIILISLLLLLLAGALLLDPLVRFMADLHLERFSQAGAVYLARIDGSDTLRGEALLRLRAYLDGQLQQYYAKKLPYDQLMDVLSALSEANLPQEDIEGCRQAAEEMEVARGYLARADACYQKGNYEEAIPLYQNALVAEDYAVLRLEQARTLYKNSVLEQAEGCMASAQYEAAQTVLLRGQTVLGADRDLSAALEDARKLEAGATYRSRTEEALQILFQEGPESAFRYMDELRSLMDDEYALLYLEQLLRHEYEADILSRATALREGGDATGACDLIREALGWIDSEPLRHLYAETRSTITFYLVEQPVLRDETADPRTEAQSTVSRDQILSDAQWNAYEHCFWADLGSVSFLLEEDFGTFVGTIAFPLGEKSTIYRASATLEIYGDGQLIAEFKDIDGTTAPIPFSLPVAGIRELTLKWTSNGADGWKDWGRFAAIFDGRFLVPAPTA